MKNIIAATAITLMAGTAAVADTLVLTAWVEGEMVVTTETGPQIDCRAIESDMRKVYDESELVYISLDLLNEDGRKVGWTYSTAIEYASAGFMLTTTCVKS